VVYFKNELKNWIGIGTSKGVCLVYHVIYEMSLIEFAFAWYRHCLAHKLQWSKKNCIVFGKMFFQQIFWIFLTKW